MNINRFLQFSLLLQLSACTLAAPLSGNYKYESSAGATVAQESTSVTYTLTIAPDKCSLVAVGFQADEKIRCKAVEEKNATAIKFVSYDDGAVLNAYGVEIYKKESTLFSLQEQDKKLITRWGSLTPDGVKKSSGVFFKSAP
ncbi:MAG TPA: DUF5991 domain-containing protein [Cellvibrionaceae bacterium]|nr:DUF5991 domain-containing protein [Cellvibrionaceae bacterium]